MRFRQIHYDFLSSLAWQYGNVCICIVDRWTNFVADKRVRLSPETAGDQQFGRYQAIVAVYRITETAVQGILHLTVSYFYFRTASHYWETDSIKAIQCNGRWVIGAEQFSDQSSAQLHDTHIAAVVSSLQPLPLRLWTTRISPDEGEKTLNDWYCDITSPMS